jgi:hypothetical protein
MFLPGFLLAFPSPLGERARVRGTHRLRTNYICISTSLVISKILGPKQDIGKEMEYV